MAEENENIVEEVSNETPEQVEQPKVEQPRNEKGQFVSKFESAGDDSVIKVDLDQPPPTQEVKKVEEKESTEEINVVDKKPESLEEPVEETVEEVVQKKDETIEQQVEEKSIIEEVATNESSEIEKCEY